MRATRLATLVLVVALGGQVWAESPLQLELGSSFRWGAAYELVLRNGTYENPISLLTWPIAGMVSADVKGTVNWLPWTRTSIALQSSRQVGTGTVIDEDWNADSLVYGRSTHTSYLTAHIQGTLEHDFLWEKGAFGAGVLYRWSNWEAWNGDYRYEYSNSVSSGQISGLVLAYRQEWLIPYVKTSWTWSSGWGEWTPELRFGPYSWCYDRDDHLTTAKRYTYLDLVEGGVYGSASLIALFPGGTGWSWGFRGSWELAWGAIGYTVTTTPTQGSQVTYPVSQKSAGAWFQEASVSLFVRN